jgi:hypothetical protein
LKIGEKVENTEIQNFATNDLSIEAIEGDGGIVEKGGNRALQELQDKLRSSEIKSIDILKITNNKFYYKDLLMKYVSTLGIKQIVFIKDGKFVPIELLQKLKDERLNEDDKSVVISCGSGLTACVVLLALSQVSDNRLSVYDGSWTEWGLDRTLPLEN